MANLEGEFWRRWHPDPNRKTLQNSFILGAKHKYPIQILQDNEAVMTIATNKNVGIGTNNPTKGKLQIQGKVDYTAPNNGHLTYFNFKKEHIVTAETGVEEVSIYVSDDIMALEFQAFSDKRIKNIEGVSNTKEDLETLNAIDVTNYTMKDVITKGNKPIF